MLRFLMEHSLPLTDRNGSQETDWQELLPDPQSRTTNDKTREGMANQALSTLWPDTR
jgi:hypothetical protein